jgi:hypothetical protein
MKFFKLAALSFFLTTFSLFAHPFNYDLHLTYLEGNNKNTLICLHGMGGDYQIGQFIKEQAHIQGTVVSFNFPDYLQPNKPLNVQTTTFGTINELLPAFYVLKKCIVDEKRQNLDVYGFSAGGGALINVISILTKNTYDPQLAKLGIGLEEKKQIQKALQKGLLILDAPLKSVEEVKAFRTHMPELKIIAKRYKENAMEPIDNLQYLKGNAYNILLFFQNPDEIISNRDDNIYIERLKKYNALGTTRVLIGNDGGHSSFHPTLWNTYRDKK